MADITRWDPFAEISTLRQAMDRLFDDTRPWRLGNGSSSTNYFPLDMYETNDNVVVKASLPGVKPEDIDISVTGQTLTLRGEVREEHEEKGESYIRRERSQGTFFRQVTLPSEVDPNKADAVFEHGVLRLTLPKAESMKPRHIKVHSSPAIEAKAS
ncbi:MAG TPA: Hsp20/alpha crystallin family protein [Dehalococcoidia bacterium]|nr:Hsp20/alpha crystallin family protein [Dehalococcoidia bacterium]